ncbi:hypothetical protein A6V39_05630 [Candidatus Mycoplasma haematobovis]|uniref:Uncharacterized protein n=1 Tax=Candidatus Mycoplasma haematobovis TaxID=432608 RepID=A0A1A9QF01_9MOLU|nr:hypothetical protein [Candidatus Mycoplasma haematobovis]OAL10818.1 hypothetical protein A6V39_05630 [Candidatus Mycoplasma haematobovis]
MEWKVNGKKALEWEAKEAIFKRKAGTIYGNPPWANELLAIFSKGNTQRNVPSLIAEWCMNNSDGDVGINSTKG